MEFMDDLDIEEDRKEDEVKPEANKDEKEDDEKKGFY